MYNNNDEMMLVDDFDADIKRREELLAEIKAFEPTSDWNATMKTVSRLQKSWKKINYGESAYEDKLEEEFQACVDAIYAKRKEGYAANAEVKQALVNEAKEASKSTNWNKGTEKMNELMNQWKASGSAGKEKDDDLVLSVKIVYNEEYVKQNYPDMSEDDFRKVVWNDIKEINKTLPQYKYIKNFKFFLFFSFGHNLTLFPNIYTSIIS